MITSLMVIAAVGLAVLALTAAVIGALDATRASSWRRVAAERRVIWERRQQLQGQRRHVEAWADEDDD